MQKSDNNLNCIQIHDFPFAHSRFLSADTVAVVKCIAAAAAATAAAWQGSLYARQQADNMLTTNKIFKVMQTFLLDWLQSMRVCASLQEAKNTRRGRGK